MQNSTDLNVTYDTNNAQINANQSYYFSSSSTQNRQDYYFHRLGMARDHTDDSVAHTMSSLGDDDDDDDGTEMQAISPIGRYVLLHFVDDDDTLSHHNYCSLYSITNDHSNYCYLFFSLLYNYCRIYSEASD